jgi:ferredoxin
MKAFVDKDTCIGCELCVSLCPEVFEMKGPVAVAKPDDVPPASIDTCNEAVSSCPVTSIRVEG